KIRDLGRSEGLPEGDVDGGELELEFDFDWCKKVVGVLKVTGSVRFMILRRYMNGRVLWTVEIEGIVDLEDNAGKVPLRKKAVIAVEATKSNENGKLNEQIVMNAICNMKPSKCALYNPRILHFLNRWFAEEEQYKVYDRGDGIMSAYKKVGVFHQLHILGVPKSFEYMQNSLDDDVPVKHFYARIHQAPKRNTHVDYCEPFEGEGPP
ncbi:hypothetical protein HN873_058550, partial [Arachis hypogaea]